MRNHLLAVVTASVMLFVWGCKSGVLPDTRPHGPRAKVEEITEITEDLSDFKLVEIERPKNASGTEVSGEFLQGISDRMVDTLAALWLFGVITPVAEAETGRELASTLIVRTEIMEVREADRINPLASGHEVTANLTFIEKKTGRTLGVYRLGAPVRGKPPFDSKSTGTFTRFALSLADILEDHAKRAADKRGGD